MFQYNHQQCTSIANILSEGMCGIGIFDDADEIAYWQLKSVEDGERSIDSVREWAKDVKEAVKFLKLILPNEYGTMNENFMIEEVEEQWAEMQVK